MLIGIIGDIHGNIEALTATLDYFDRLAVRTIFCAGDIVGYGASPAECIKLIQDMEIPCVRGNHDFYTAFPDKYDRRTVRDDANTVIDWNCRILSDRQKQWLAELPGEIVTKDFMITHASCQPYPEWCYVTTTRAVAVHMLYQKHSLCFNAHCHVPIIATHTPGRSVTLNFLRNTTIDRRMRTMVGVGAVGQPRDEDPRACAVLFNTDNGKLNLLRVRYNITGAQQRIIDNGLPTFLAERLAKGI